ncbi:MAG: hypothetical protein AB8B53_11145 [Flavobacteriales bacterium]
MNTIKTYKDLEILIKRTALWAVLLFISSSAYSSVLDCISDTLIIDGITIGVEVEEEPEDSTLIEDKDSIPAIIPKKDRNFNLGMSYTYGLGRAEVLKETTSDPVDLFIGNEKVPQSFQSINVFTEILSLEKLSIEIGLSHSTWSQTFTQVDSELTDITWAFDSPSDGSLFQITRVVTPLGVEFDSLEMRLSEDKWKQSYIELPITLLERLTPKKNKLGVSVGLSIIPGYSYTSYEGTTYILSQTDIELFESSKPSAQRLNLSGQIEGRLNRQFTDHINAFFNVGFRNNFTGLFSSQSPVELSRSVGFASLGLHFFF